MKFTFTSEFQGFGSPKNTLEFESDQLADVVKYFEQFLRGSGYHFDGELDLCNITEPAEKYYPNNCDVEPETFEIKMPGTIGGAELTFPNDRCKVCGLTADQLGDHNCYDANCGLK